ncbi:MAG TPA: EAL domain-containing protein, partial [Solirubrobacteraceae bacterium]|nr:EAL domain-containing protein [Solirubrobacteraceae bacterium]
AGLGAGAVVAALGVDALADGGGVATLPVVSAVCDVIVACVVAGVIGTTAGRPGRTWILLGTGLAFVGVSDLLYAGQTASGTYVEGTLLDAGWVVGLALLAAGAASRRSRGPVRVPDWAGVVIPGAFTVVAAAVLVGWQEPLPVVLAALALLAAVARTARLFADLLRTGVPTAAGEIDALTGLPTRRALTARLETIARRDEPAALLVVDLDRFRRLNETLGHEAGDRVLADVAARLRDAVRPGDVLARLGGDEFAVLLSGAHDAAGARALAQRLRFQFDLAFAVDGIAVQLDASIGIALRPLHALSAGDLLRTADLAMEEAKAEHCGVVTYRPRALSAARERLALMGQLRDALDRGELVVHLQPLVDAESERLMSVEALVRWEHPERGLLGPADFLPSVEQANLMRPLTEYVVREALLLARAWRDAGTPTPIAVNVAGPNLLDLAFAEKLARLLEETGASPADLRLEITEDGVMLDEDRVLAGMAALRRLGVTVALDDFGTGQSSLARLRRLPVDVLKIDRSFVMGMDSDAADGAIVRAAASLGRELGLTVVAEGVETRSAWKAVRDAGCHLVQGYLVSRPLDVAAFETWRAAWVAGAAHV